jgi:hypothetical protein
LENFSFTFNDAEDYAASEKWQKISIYLIIETIISVSVSLNQCRGIFSPLGAKNDSKKTWSSLVHHKYALPHAVKCIKS